MEIGICGSGALFIGFILVVLLGSCYGIGIVCSLSGQKIERDQKKRIINQAKTNYVVYGQFDPEPIRYKEKHTRRKVANY